MRKAQGVCEKARAAIAARDSRQLQETTEALSRTLNMFKGVVSKSGNSVRVGKPLFEFATYRARI